MKYQVLLELIFFRPEESEIRILIALHFSSLESTDDMFSLKFHFA